MELKKSPKADLKNKRGLLLEIGLVVSLGLVIAAFAYTPKEHRIQKMDINAAVVEEDVAEITRNDQKPPEPPKKVEVQVLSDILNIVKNDTKITSDLKFDDFSEDAAVAPIVKVEEEEIVEDQPFITVEKMPTFQGGDLNTFRTWVQSNLVFPQIAIENGISGKVTVSFVIEKDGRLTNIQVIQSPDRSLADEAVRVLKKSPKWNPGKQRNQAVRVKYHLPVEFRLQN
ncbi:MAG: energy transducer TonB [Alistipes sp.]